MENKWVKLSQLVDSTFTVEDAGSYTWKKWNAEAKRMETSEKWKEGFRKMYSIKTDKGTLDLGSGQLSSLLESVYYKGSSNIVGKTFSVSSNGKTGLDIRYFFRPAKEEKPQDNFNTFVEKKNQLGREDDPADIEALFSS